MTDSRYSSLAELFFLRPSAKDQRNETITRVVVILVHFFIRFLLDTFLSENSLGAVEFLAWALLQDSQVCYYLSPSVLVSEGRKMKNLALETSNTRRGIVFCDDEWLYRSCGLISAAQWNERGGFLR